MPFDLQAFLSTPISDLPKLQKLPSKIEHHGVKGMKWGVRKKRPTANRVKTATAPNGNKVTAQKTGRSSALISVNGKPITKINPNKTLASLKKNNLVFKPKDSSKSAQIDAKNAQSKAFAKTATDAELRAAINRIKMEAEYTSLTLQKKPLKAWAIHMKDRAIKTGEDLLFESAKAAAKPYVGEYFSGKISQAAASKENKANVKAKAPVFDAPDEKLADLEKDNAAKEAKIRDLEKKLKRK